MMRIDCRCCCHESLTEVYSLGSQPHANSFLVDPSNPETISPLTVMECSRCGQVQLLQVESPSHLYHNYSFVTSTSSQMVDHFACLMRENIAKYVHNGGLVVEIGSNDGAVLSTITQPVRVLGVDPARNLAVIARSRGVVTVSSFFTEALSHVLVAEYGHAHLIVACNVLAHVDDLDDFCNGIKRLLARDGAFVIEVPDINELLEHNEFDTIYHEHLSYFSLRALVYLFDRHGLYVDSVEKQNVHGGSMRLVVRHGRKSYAVAGAIGAVESWIRRDLAARNWRAFRERCELFKNNLLAWLRLEKANRRVTWGYCASAKATVLLNYCGITPDLLPIVVDSTPEKQGRFMPGTHQIILPTRDVYLQHPDSVLVLADNHFEAILKKEAEYVANGGRIVRKSSV